MKYHKIYLIPTPGNSLEASTATVTSLTTSIESHFPTASRQNNWTLSHRIFQSVPPKSDSPTDRPQPSSTSLQHFLGLSALSADSTFCFIHALTSPPQAPQAPARQDVTQRKDAGTIIQIPNSSRDAHIAMILGPMSALWTPRQLFAIPNGAAYTSGPFEILLGEIRAPRSGPSQSSAAASPGVVVCLSTEIGQDAENQDRDQDQNQNGRAEAGYGQLDGGGDDTMEVDNEDGSGDGEFEAAKSKVEDLWRKIRVDFGRAQVLEMGVRKEDVKRDGDERSERDAVARLWCDVLTPSNK